ncbi:hypothetical protein B0H16DRAFT_1531388 [Mycena metata]|uniref:Uncharacterized protein n=1 Tax=Mycena metata TaxID=1033252 RepID=A0AAD7JAX1_9AGAR|nr:hypothetical protein B0H16DRAFT_1531388 [Mycena metata]
MLSSRRICFLWIPQLIFCRRRTKSSRAAASCGTLALSPPSLITTPLGTHADPDTFPLPKEQISLLLVNDRVHAAGGYDLRSMQSRGPMQQRRALSLSRSISFLRARALLGFTTLRHQNLVS